jgi:hypothetical protein
MNDLVINDITKITKIKYKEHTDNVFFTRITPYNTQSTIPLHKYWIHIDKCKLINISKTQMTIGINNTEKCIEIIKELELKLHNIINEDFGYNVQLYSKLIDNDNSIPIMNISYDINTKFFDANDMETQCIDSNNIGNEFTVIIELDVLNLFTDKTVMIWKVVQVKKTEMLNMTKSLFSMLSPPVSRPSYVQQPSISYQHETVIEPFKNTLKVIAKPTTMKAAFMPSMSDLKGALKSLKPVANTDSKDVPVSPLNDVLSNNIPQLKHVETREPVQFVDILKKEHLEKEKKIMTDEYYKMISIKNNIRLIIKKQKRLYNSCTCDE